MQSRSSVKGKGRGVFARRLIRQGEVIEQVPMLVLTAEEFEDRLAGTSLANYCFAWGRGTMALTLGYGSLSKPLVPAQRPLRRRGSADQGVHGGAGHRAG